MKPGARLQAAVEVLTDVLERHRPASEALADWGKSHRFAGSGDRAAIGNIVYDCLRRRLSVAARMGDDAPRALVIGGAAASLGMSPDEVIAVADGSAYALAPLSEAEVAGVRGALPDNVAAHVAGDYPEWLADSFTRTFADGAAAEGVGLASRAPLDLRANTLKAEPEKVIRALARFGAEPTPLSPVGVRIAAAAGGGRTPNVEVEPGHAKGWFEVQDEGSQIAALLAGARPRQQVLDLCAGAGGKTLALAAAMANSGQIYAYDVNRHQLRPIFDRLKRAGARNVQVLAAGDTDALAELGPRFDIVLVDAPCTGSGVWRRRPDAKWRVKPANLAERQVEQRAVLTQAWQSVRPGGRLVYVTCSVLAEENTDAVVWLLEQAPELEIVPTAELWSEAFGDAAPASADGCEDTLLLTPARHGTDGFFVAGFRRRA